MEKAQASIIGLEKRERERVTSFKALLKRDPSRTLTIRRAFAADMRGRFTKLLRVIRAAVVDKNVFGLRPGPLSALEPLSFEEAFASIREKQFAFSRSSDKVDGFMDWLNEMEEAGILEVIHRPGTIRGIEEAWTDKYIHTAYQKGILRAGQEMNAVGANLPTETLQAAFNHPIHVDRVGLLYTRAFNELKGVNKAMDQAISRVLAQGLAEGRGVKELSRLLTKQVDKIGKVRGELIAHTEVIRAHHSANIAEYRRAGIAGVHVKAEWSTAGFNVCPECMAMEGEKFTLDEIESMIPAHPRCRCVALPWRKEWEEKEEEE